RREQQQIDAEARAADRSLEIEERLLSIREAAKSRAAERVGAAARDIMANGAPMEPAPVTDLSDASAQALGMEGGMTGNVDAMREQYTAMLSAPGITGEQRTALTEMLAQIDRQAQQQAGINAKQVAGQTRPVTSQEEAIRLAKQKLAIDDPTAVEAYNKAVGPEVRAVDADARIIDRDGRTVHAGTSKVAAANARADDRNALREREIEAKEQQASARIEKLAKSGDKNEQTLQVNTWRDAAKAADGVAERLRSERAKAYGDERTAIDSEINEKQREAERYRGYVAQLTSAAGLKLPAGADPAAQQMQAGFDKAQGKRLKYNPVTGKVE
ncbi:MAG TPA: hypothetical protein VIT92_00330, partial [Burkholderiaceae bacterium]